jgi:hypothetical protein
VTKLVAVNDTVVGYAEGDPGGFTALQFGAAGLDGLRVTPRGVERTSDGGANWIVAKPGDAARVAVAADYDHSGIALATLYPDLLVQTNDGGMSWEVVNVLPGRGGARLRFVSSANAFVALEGTVAWQEF